MRVGLVCPYSLDVPGGVQNHVVDLAETLLAAGHQVSVLAPGEDDADLPDHVVVAGRAVPVPYNGSVARVAFGPLSAARTRRWLRDGEFDVVHVHEPTTPSLSLIALAASTAPVVATFHTATERSRAMAAAAGVLRPALEKISGRIAVSQIARRTVAQHLGGDAVVIPNGIFVSRFSGLRTPRQEPADEPVLVFLGRFEEPRKGLPVLLAGFQRLLRTHPRARLVVAGRGDVATVRDLTAEAARRVSFVGPVDEGDRSRLLASADVFVAPNTGGESFGIILLEAMAAGAPVVASDLPAFCAVCADGRLGRHFRTGDPVDLAAALAGTLDDVRGTQARAGEAARAVLAYDWSAVTRQVVAVYDAVTAGRSDLWSAP